MALAAASLSLCPAPRLARGSARSSLGMMQRMVDSHRARQQQNKCGLGNMLVGSGVAKLGRKSTRRIGKYSTPIAAMGRGEEGSEERENVEGGGDEDADERVKGRADEEGKAQESMETVDWEQLASTVEKQLELLSQSNADLLIGDDTVVQKGAESPATPPASDSWALGSSTDEDVSLLDVLNQTEKNLQQQREGQDVDAESTSSAQEELITSEDESDLPTEDSTEVLKSVFDDERFTWEDASPQVLAEVQKSNVVHPSVDDLMEDGTDRYIVEEDGTELLDVVKDEPPRLSSGDRIDLDQYKRLSCEHRDFLVPVSEDGDALNLARALIQVDKEENFCVYKPMATEGEVPDMMLKYNLVSWESTETGVNTSGMRGPTQNMVTVKVITEKYFAIRRHGEAEGYDCKLDLTEIFELDPEKESVMRMSVQGKEMDAYQQPVLVVDCFGRLTVTEQATIPHAEEIVQKYNDEAGLDMEEIIMNANIEEYDFDLDEAPDVPEVDLM